MVLYPDYVEVKDFSKTFTRFPFTGISHPGYCFLKIHVQNGTPVFFCVQLINYEGTPIASGEDDIRERALNMLVREGIVVSRRPRSLLDRVFTRRFEEKQRQDIQNYLIDKSLWIRYYPPETTDIPGGSYAIVTFCPELKRYMFTTRKRIVRTSGLPDAFFDLSNEELDVQPDAFAAGGPVRPTDTDGTGRAVAELG